MSTQKKALGRGLGALIPSRPAEPAPPPPPAASPGLANVPIDQLPGWMQAISSVLPFTHGIEAAREIADGATLADVGGLLATEAAIGVAYSALGFAFIRHAERLSLRYATLDRN